MRNERQAAHLMNSTTRIFMLKMKQVQATCDRPFLLAPLAFTSAKESGHLVVKLYLDLRVERSPPPKRADFDLGGCPNIHVLTCQPRTIQRKRVRKEQFVLVHASHQ